MQLALTETYSADFSSYANSSVALMLGVALTGVICGIVRLLGADWIAGRLLRSNWTTLAAVAERRSDQDRLALASLMQHRLALLAARITVVPAEAKERRRQSSPASDGSEYSRRRGRASSGLSRRARAAIEAFSRSSCLDLQESTRSARFPMVWWDSSTTRSHLTLQEPSGEARDQVLMGLAGIRSGLSRNRRPINHRKSNTGQLPHEIRT